MDLLNAGSAPSDAVLALVHALADGQWHSGEQLARAEGLSRAALGKRIARARTELNLDIEGEPGRGYRLARPLDLIDPARLRSRLGDRLRKLQWLAVTDSTNTRMLEADPADDPQLCLADMQTAGRGRRGRQWHSPYAANLYLSLAWSFQAFPTGITGLPLALGTAAAEYLHGLGLRDIGVKWPNDLVLHDGAGRLRKLGGLLVESRGEAAGGCRVVIGLGLNVHMHEAPGLSDPWASLATALPSPPDRTALAAGIAEALLITCDTLGREGFSAFAPRFARHDVLAGRPVRVSGNPTIDGIARGIDAHGALLVEHEGSQRAVHAGDVSVRPA